MKVRTLLILLRVVVEFFTYESAWAASSTLKLIFFSRIVILAAPFTAFFVLGQAAVQWPRESDQNHLVTKREADQTQKSNEQFIAILRGEVAETRAAQALVLDKLSQLVERTSRTETKVDWLSALIGGTCSVVGLQLIAALMSMRLRKTISHAERRHPEDLNP